MEQEAAQPNDQIADKAKQEHFIMSISDTAGNAAICQVDKRQIRERVDNFGGIGCCIVVLIVG